MLPPSHPHPELQSIETIQAAHPFAIDPPAFPPEQDPDPLIAEAGSRVGQIADAQPQHRLIFRLTFAIPGCPAKLG